MRASELSYIHCKSVRKAGDKSGQFWPDFGKFFGKTTVSRNQGGRNATDVPCNRLNSVLAVALGGIGVEAVDGIGEEEVEIPSRG